MAFGDIMGQFAMRYAQSGGKHGPALAYLQKRWDTIKERKASEAEFVKTLLGHEKIARSLLTGGGGLQGTQLGTDLMLDERVDAAKQLKSYLSAKKAAGPGGDYIMVDDNVVLLAHKAGIQPAPNKGDLLEANKIDSLLAPLTSGTLHTRYRTRWDLLTKEQKTDEIKTMTEGEIHELAVQGDELAIAEAKERGYGKGYEPPTWADKIRGMASEGAKKLEQSGYSGGGIL